MARPLRQRPLDALWLSFFAIHLFASLAVDFRAFYPSQLVPRAFKALLSNYLAQSGDPLLGSLARPESAWFRSFVWHEAVVQVPCFALGIIALWQDDKRVYPLLFGYGAASATTTWACLFHILRSDAYRYLSPAQLSMLLSSYVPFFLVPLGIAVDMYLRTMRLVSRALQDERDGKTR